MSKNNQIYGGPQSRLPYNVPTGTTITLPPVQNVCNGQTVTLTATNDQWNLNEHVTFQNFSVYVVNEKVADENANEFYFSKLNRKEMYVLLGYISDFPEKCVVQCMTSNYPNSNVINTFVTDHKFLTKYTKHVKEITSGK